VPHAGQCGRVVVEDDVLIADVIEKALDRASGPSVTTGGRASSLIYRGVILDPMHSALVHRAFDSTVDATTSPRLLMSCSTVSERLGHASVAFTLDVYAHTNAGPTGRRCRAGSGARRRAVTNP
jgi:integrase